MVLVLSHPDDPHAQQVISCLRASGHEVLLLNLSDLPERATLTMDYDGDAKPAIVYRRIGETPFDLGRVRSVWWRRPQPFDPASVSDGEIRLFANNEWNEAIQGLWQLLRARWMNPPLNDDAASRKVLQLRMAAVEGLQIPRTLITSDPDRARAFIESQGIERTVYKTFSCTHAIWRETRLLRAEDLEVLDSVRLAPVIFQEYIRAEADLRITIVGGKLFPAAIRFPPNDEPVDFRLNLGRARTEPTTLPPDVEARLLALMDRLGLVYGAVDMRRTSDGQHVFLEVNTAGEFLFIEDRTGQPIARAIANWLAGDPGLGVPLNGTHRDLDVSDLAVRNGV